MDGDADSRPTMNPAAVPTATKKSTMSTSAASAASVAPFDMMQTVRALAAEGKQGRILSRRLHRFSRASRDGAGVRATGSLGLAGMSRGSFNW